MLSSALSSMMATETVFVRSPAANVSTSSLTVKSVPPIAVPLTVVTRTVTVLVLLPFSEMVNVA